MPKTAIIIGAGPAGLTAAYQLLKETSIKPVIYEENPVIGGISRTVSYLGGRLDIGPHRFFSKNEYVNEIWKELMPIQGAPSKEDKMLGIEKPLEAGGPDPDTNDKMWLIRDRLTRIFFLRKFFDYPISIKPQTFINMGLIRTLQVVFGYCFAAIKKRKEKSLEDFYINRFGKPLYRLFFEDYTEKLWGIHPSNIAPDWGAQRVKELSIGKVITEILAKIINKNYRSKTTSLIDRFIYPKNGSGEFWETMAEKIKELGGEIHLNSKIVSVKKTGETITSVIIQKNKSEMLVSGDIFFSCMSIKDFMYAIGKDNVPHDVFKNAVTLPYRDLIVVGLLLKKLRINNTTKIRTFDNRVPDCWFYIQDRNVRMGRMQITNNLSPYLVDNYEDTIGLGLEYFCDEGDDMWEMREDAFIKYSIEELAKIDIIDKDDVLNTTYIKVKKAYPAYFGSYKEFGNIQSYLDGIKNLYCIGRNGQHRYNNMDHSMMTAIEAVNLIKTGNSDKTSVWNINKEEEYLEEKENKKVKE